MRLLENMGWVFYCIVVQDKLMLKVFNGGGEMGIWWKNWFFRYIREFCCCYIYLYYVFGYLLLFIWILRFCFDVVLMFCDCWVEFYFRDSYVFLDCLEIVFY